MRAGNSSSGVRRTARARRAAHSPTEKMRAMDWKDEWKKLALILLVFLGCFWLPVGEGRFDNAITESLHLVKWYAREHVLLCLVPAFFIAGAIGVFVSQASGME